MTTASATLTRPAAKRGRPVKKTSTVLVNAKDILENGRWVKGCLKRGGGHCSVGAVCAAVGYDFKSKRYPSGKAESLGMAAETALDDATRALTNSNYVVSFNDSQKTTKRQVLAVFDEAIRTARRIERANARRKLASAQASK